MPLFELSQQYNSYSGILRCILKSRKSYMNFYGVKANDLASYPYHKINTIKIASEFTVTFPFASMYIRTGWLMGGNNKRYVL